MRLWWCALLPALAAGLARPTAPQAVQRGTPADPTFARDIAPVLYDNCVPCHRPGQAAPFSLIDYADVKSRADRIVRATETGRMPPWLPEPGQYTFVGDRHLRPDQIAVIRRWADTGAPEGNPADLPRLSVPADGWQLGQPDLVVTPPRPFMLAPAGGHGHDQYRHIVYPLSLPVGRFVRAVEFRPGTAPVHHAVLRIDRTQASRRRDGADGQPGFDGVMAPDVQGPDGRFIGWTPGQGPIVSPTGMPWRLDGGSDLVVELHLIPGASAMAVQPTIGFFFTDQPPTERPVALTMGVKTIDIPAGARAHRVTTSYAFPVEVTLLSLYPHAHYLGTDMQVTAVLPDGTATSLIHIPRWDFHWQQEYRFATPPVLPKGTTLSMTYTYDNSADNAANPSVPPRRVTYGTRSTDEMGNLAIQVLPRSAGDGRTLVKAFAERDLRENVASAELLARLNPASAEQQGYLGRAYVEAGRNADAIAPLEVSLRLDPSSATAHDYLGRALFAEHQPDAALGHLREAVRLAPRDEVMQIDLGKVLLEAGRTAEAMQAFQRALTINPDYSQAYQGVGVVFAGLGRFNEAAIAFRRAVELTPDSAPAENGLAVALAQAGQMEEALKHVLRALELDPDYAPARDNLVRMRRGG